MINRVNIKNFQIFDNFQISNFTPVNVIIGRNDSGKTSLLKILYTVTKSVEEFGLKQQHSPESFKKIISKKIQNTFNTHKTGIGSLVKRGTEKLFFDLTFDNNQSIHFSFTDRATENIVDCSASINNVDNCFNSLFIPAKEVLSIFKAIETSRGSLFVPDFDDTYLDLVNALKIPTQQGRVETNLLNVNNILSHLFEGEIQQVNEGFDIDFVFKKGKYDFAMPVTAEGIKKIGVITTLIRNHRLNKNTILFMDEPDTNLHPDAIRQLCEIIYDISKAGIQIFLSSHNYFLIKQLSIIARREKQSMNCLSLCNNEEQKTQYLIADLKDGMPSNSIIDEALKMLDDETDIDLK